MKFEFVDPNTQYKYEFEFYNESYGQYYLLYTIHMENFSSMSSAYKIVNNMIEWPKQPLIFSPSAEDYCNNIIKNYEKILKLIAFI